MTLIAQVHHVNSYNDLLQKLAAYSKIIIYGAGKIASAFYSGIENFLNGSISINVIQTTISNESFFYGIKIKDCSYLKLCDPENSIVVIAVNNKNRNEILQFISLYYSGNIICIGEDLINDLMHRKVSKDRLKLKTLSICFADIPNMGDQLNPLILKRLFGYNIHFEEPLYCEMTGIGSGLDALFRGKETVKRMTEYPISIAGTGFLNGDRLYDKVPIRDMIFYGVRGYKSLHKLEDYYGKKTDCVVGDPGLLTYFLKKNVDKEYAIGIIPHWRELSLNVHNDLLMDLKGGYFIDITKDAESVLLDIEKCETVISSSLHGCIVADAFGIPNTLVKFSNKPLGDGFKYGDYYSIYGDICKINNISDYGSVSAQRIKNEYVIDYRIVEKKAHELQDMFSRCLSGFS